MNPDDNLGRQSYPFTMSQASSDFSLGYNVTSAEQSMNSDLAYPPLHLDADLAYPPLDLDTDLNLLDLDALSTFNVDLHSYDNYATQEPVEGEPQTHRQFTYQQDQYPLGAVGGAVSLGHLTSAVLPGTSNDPGVMVGGPMCVSQYPAEGQRKGYTHRHTRQFLPDGAEKQQRQRRLNNEASRLRNQRKKEKQQQLQQEFTELQRSNEDLKTKYARLQRLHQNFPELLTKLYGKPPQYRQLP